MKMTYVRELAPHKYEYGVVEYEPDHIDRYTPHGVTDNRNIAVQETWAIERVLHTRRRP